MTIRTTARARILTAAVGVAAASALVATTPPAGSSAAAAAQPSGSTNTSATTQGYTPGSRDDALNAQLRKQLDAALKQQQSKSTKALATTIVTYDASQAPSFASEISQAASIWNSSVSNVRLQPGSPANLTYYEGSDPSGSYYSGDGHGNGYILIDYDQATQYDPLRIVAHETGHNMGLPDHYSGPCSELMSGGGPGPSCTNPYPNGTESSQVDALWANGFAAAFNKAAFGSVK